LPGACNDNQWLVEGHEHLTHAARMVAQKGINMGHLWVIFVGLKEVLPQFIRAFSKAYAVAFVQDLSM
jgi:hypothetical protein